MIRKASYEDIPELMELFAKARSIMRASGNMHQWNNGYPSEEVVRNDIDNEVVNIIRQFKDAFKSVTARREIKKKLRSILWIKYQIKDNDVFERAYSYIEQYY